MLKPSTLEHTVLKLYLEKNKFPSEQDKETIVKKLHSSLGTSVKVEQLENWLEVDLCD